MKVGSIVYATDSGLGILAKSFYDNGVVNNVLIARHHHFPTHQEWYPNARQFEIKPFDHETVEQFCRSMDVMLFFETPFSWPLITWCRANSIKTILMPMHECTPVTIPEPDLYLCPSKLDLDVFGSPHVDYAFVPVPVQVSWRQRHRAEVFVHNAGHGGLKGRNGTAELIEAMKFVKSPIKLIIRTQKALTQYNTDNPRKLDPRIHISSGTISYDELYSQGDVFIFPEKFNGLSLPLQEAFASGMLVMGSNRHPMNKWLPVDPLITTAGTRKNRIGPAYREFDESIIDPLLIAKKIDEWYGRDISYQSRLGQLFAAEMYWSVLKPVYMELIGGLVK